MDSITDSPKVFLFLLIYLTLQGLQELLDVLENGEELESKFVVKMNTEPTTRSIMNPIPHNNGNIGGFIMT